MTADHSHNEKITTEGFFIYQLELSLDFFSITETQATLNNAIGEKKHRFLWMWSYLLKKPLMENFIFCAVI